MNKQSYFTIGALVIAVLTIGIIGYTVREPVVNVETNKCELGAVSGPRVDFPEFEVNGLKHLYFSDTGSKATSSVCAFKIKNATSTLIFASLKAPSGITGTLFMEIGKGNDPTATTTSIVINTASQNAVVDMVATTSLYTTFSPGQWLVFKVSSTTPANLVSSCKAEFIEN